MNSNTKNKNYENDLKEESRREPIDAPLLILVLLLLAVGLIMMFSASYAVAYYQMDGNSAHFFIKQGGFAAAGIVAMFFMSFYDYHRLRRFSVPSMIIAVILLIAVLFIGTEINEAKRWISLGFTTFQPSEFAKVAVILGFSSLATAYGNKMKKFKYGIIPFFLIIACFAGLLYFEPHLSGTIIIALTGIVIIFVGGANIAHLATIFTVGIGGVLGFIMTQGYAKSRLDVWLNPFIDPLGKGWQGVQSLLAIGSGGIWGLGLGQSRQKHLFLPEPANDFIFSVVCEELGMIGAMLILCAFAALIIRGYWVAIRARDKFGCLLAVGITTQLAIQTIVNIYVVTGLMPVTGASLPLFSYGGTSLFLQLVEIGILLNISRQIPAPRQG